MGRHRRSGAVPAAEDPTAGSQHAHRDGGRRKRRTAPVRTGLLGASAALAVGAVAVTSGLLPGGDTYTLGGGTATGESVRTGGSPELRTQGERSASPADRGTASPSRSAERAHAPSKTPSPARTAPSSTPPSTPSSTPSQRTAASQAAKTGAAPASPSRTAAGKPGQAAEKVRTKAPARPSASAGRPSASTPAGPSASAPAGPSASAPMSSREAAAGAAVLGLVNAERAKVGCRPVRASSSLTALAAAFSKDMAERGFFSHTDPDGNSPWERAERAGVGGLAGENIARGQADAQAVMASWMASDGHRANILNCDYTTLGVGVHFGPGGPWWTQDFGS